MIRFLAGLFIGGTLAVVAYIELSARRGVAADGFYVKPDTLYHIRSHSFSMDSDGTIRESDDWATDPRTAELATGGGQEGAGR